MRGIAIVMFLALMSGGCSFGAQRSTAGLMAAPVRAGAEQADELPLAVVVAARPSRGSPAVGNFVRGRDQQLQFCYEESRAKSPTLAGSVTVAVRLENDGTVRDADIVRRSWSANGSEPVESCVLNRVRGWRFPKVAEADEHVHSFAVIFSR